MMQVRHVTITDEEDGGDGPMLRSPRAPRRSTSSTGKQALKKDPLKGSIHSEATTDTKKKRRNSIQSAKSHNSHASRTSQGSSNGAPEDSQNGSHRFHGSQSFQSSQNLHGSQSFNNSIQFHGSAVFSEKPKHQQVVTATEELRKKFESKTDLDLQIGGVPALTVAFKKTTVKDLKKILPLLLIGIVFVFYLIFGLNKTIMYPFLIIVLSNVCTFGAAGHLGIGFNVMTSMIPSILVAISHRH